MDINLADDQSTVIVEADNIQLDPPSEAEAVDDQHLSNSPTRLLSFDYHQPPECVQAADNESHADDHNCTIVPAEVTLHIDEDHQPNELLISTDEVRLQRQHVFIATFTSRPALL